MVMRERYSWRGVPVVSRTNHPVWHGDTKFAVTCHRACYPRCLHVVPLSPPCGAAFACAGHLTVRSFVAFVVWCLCRADKRSRRTRNRLRLPQPVELPVISVTVSPPRLRTRPRISAAGNSVLSARRPFRRLAEQSGELYDDGHHRSRHREPISIRTVPDALSLVPGLNIRPDRRTRRARHTVFIRGTNSTTSRS